MMELKTILAQTIAVVKEVGVYLKGEFDDFDKSDIETKSAGHDLVSYVDQTSEKKLVKGLLEVVDANIIGEEGTSSEIDTTKEYQWIIGPLDGTTNFAHGVPAFAISVALAKGDDILIGVVLEISRNECFAAGKGLGTTLNGKKIAVSTQSVFNKGLYATGFPYDFKGKLPQYMNIFEHIAQNSHGLRRFGSAAVDLCFVAAGRFEGYYEFNLNPWDVAAGIVIIREAGGVVTDFAGTNDVISGQEIVCGAQCQPELRSIINRYW